MLWRVLPQASAPLNSLPPGCQIPVLFNLVLLVIYFLIFTYLFIDCIWPKLVFCICKQRIPGKTSWTILIGLLDTISGLWIMASFYFLSKPEYLFTLKSFGIWAIFKFNFLVPCQLQWRMRNGVRFWITYHTRERHRQGPRDMLNTI